MISIKRRSIIITISTLVLIAIDQIIKSLVLFNLKGNINLINGFLNITYVQNRGGAFGIGQSNIITFIVVNIVVLGIIVKFMISQMNAMDKKTMIALTLILAGGIGNFLDRICRGFVIDYLDIAQFVKNYPVFNFADICIVVGWILLVISILIAFKKAPRSKMKRE